MKIYLYITLLICVLLTSGCSDKPDSSLETTIIDLARKRSQAVVKGDTATLNQILDRDFVYINTSGELLDRDNYLNGQVSFRNDSSYWISQTIDSITVRPLNNRNAVVINFKIHDELMYEGTLYKNFCRSTFVYEKKGDDWKCLLGQTTRIE